MILHLDMDAFYASVEQLDHPRLKGQCVIVGGSSARGVVSAASYEARRFGVRSAMPMFQARQRCPHGIFIPPRMDRYRHVSREVLAILREFSPQVEPVSIDEAFMDLTGTESLHGPPAVLAAALKSKIFGTLHLTCSIGVAPNRFLAKIASDYKKPDGLTVIAPDQVHEFIERLPIEKVPGVGPKTQARVAEFGIRFLGDIRKYSESALRASFGNFGSRLRELACGIDPTPVMPDTPCQSASSECTLDADTAETAVLARCLLEQAEEVAAALRQEGVKARTVILKIKHADFKLITRRTTFAPPTQSSKEIYDQALLLLNAYPLSRKVRLIGLGATGFVPADAPRQLALFTAEKTSRKGWEKVDRTVATIKTKFGEKVIGRATLQED
ncbi:MAG: DNA polymerase IV [Desulfobacterales bacterium]|jgi:DNA polymerase-4|nr:DNA polymerase IV [Desulfobacterales bacterium]